MNPVPCMMVLRATKMSSELAILIHVDLDHQQTMWRDAEMLQTIHRGGIVRIDSKRSAVI
jgi:hypothetical protein